MPNSPAGIFSDTRPRQGGLTLLIAGIVTAAVTIPLLIVALNARDKAEPASSFGISIRLSDDSAVVGANNADLPLGTAAQLVLDDPAFVAGSWAIYTVAGDKIAEGSTSEPPLQVAFDLSGLNPGAYDILVTATLGEGTTVNRAARFRVLP